jgi:uncharacterized protein YcnI
VKHPLVTNALVVFGLGTALSLGGALAASAHVTVAPNTAPADSTALLTFTVPNESATAQTIQLDINIPAATPFADVTWVPTPGWSGTLVTTHLATPVKSNGGDITDPVTKVVFIASKGSGIVEGQSQIFSIRVGGVPDVAKVAITATQHYSDGSVVQWADTSAAAEDPAPQLFVNDPAPGAKAPAAATPAPSAASPTGSGTASSSDTIARVLGALGLVAGAIGIVVGITARRKVVK